MEFTHIIRLIELIVLFGMLESFLSSKINGLKIIVFIAFVALSYNILNAFDAYFFYPLFYHFYNQISLFIFLVLCLYGFVFYLKQYKKVIYCAIFIVFNITLMHTISLYFGSLLIESASAFVQVETWFYYAYPSLEMLVVVIECLFFYKKMFYFQTTTIFPFIINGLMIIEIGIMNYLGSLYLFSHYQSIYMMFNVIMLCFILILFSSYTHYIQKYQELKISNQLYNDAIEYHKQFNKFFTKQYNSLNKINHDFKYYLHEIKKTIHNSQLDEVEKRFDEFSHYLEKNQIIYTTNTLLNLLFMQKKEEALKKNIQLNFVTIGECPAFINESDLYYLLYTLLDKLLLLNLLSIDCQIRYNENMSLKITTQTITKKDQEKIITSILPILNQYHGHAYCDDMHVFIVTLCK